MSDTPEIPKPDSDELNLNGDDADEIPGLGHGQNPDAEDAGEESDEYDDFDGEDGKDDEGEEEGGGYEDDDEEDDDEGADKGGNLTALLLGNPDGTAADEEYEYDDDADLYREEDAPAPAKNLKRNIEEVEDDEADKEAKKVKA